MTSASKVANKKFWWKFAIFLKSLFKPQVTKMTPMYFFSLNNIYFLKIFETFECSGQNLPNSLWQFWNDKSIPIQILYPSSVSWNITPLYFFSSNNIYFAQKKPIKVKTLETFEGSGQYLSNSSCQFWNDKSIPLQILHPS